MLEKVDKVSIYLGSQPKFSNNLRMPTPTLLLFTYKINKVGYDRSTYWIIIRDRTSSVVKTSIYYFSAHRLTSCLSRGYGRKSEQESLFAAVFKRFSVNWRGMIFADLTTVLPFSQWILVNFDDTNDLSDGLKLVKKSLTWEFATRNGEFHEI